MPKTDSSDVPCRRRGRPAGKNRTPLSMEERRARNAKYERQRRSETSDAMAQLAEAAGCDVGISNGDLLAAVVARLQRAANRDPSEDIERLKCSNENLMQQIAELEQRLGWTETEDDKENLTEYHRNKQTDVFNQRNKHTNIKRLETLSPNEDYKHSEQDTFGIKLYSNDRESHSDA